MLTWKMTDELKENGKAGKQLVKGTL